MSKLNKTRVPSSSNGSRKPNKTVGPPVAVNSLARQSRPMMNGKENLIISRKEFVGSVTNGTVKGFALTLPSLSTPGYDLNPSVVSMFPWLSRIAVCYERFRFNKLKFHFIPSQPTTTGGRFYAAVDYDFDDSVATSKTQLMGNSAAVEVPIWQECELTCNPAALNRELPYRYVSASSRMAYVESRTTYAGFLMCAFDTQTLLCSMDLWVEYTVEFVTPVFDDPLAQVWGGSLVPEAALMVASGGDFVGFPPPTPTVLPAGPVKLVAGGTTGVPTFPIIVDGVTNYAPFGLDLAGARGKGFLELLINTIATAHAPSTLLNAATNFISDWTGFDSSGVTVGSIKTTPAAFPAPAVQGIQGIDPGTVAVAASPIYDRYSVALEALLAANPSLRYLVPTIQSLANIGAGSTGFGFDYHF